MKSFSSQNDQNRKSVRAWDSVKGSVKREWSESKMKQWLSLQRATLDSTADGILVVDRAGTVTNFNKRFAQLWHIPKRILNSHDDRQAIRFVLKQLKFPKQFLQRVQWLYAHPKTESFDVLEFKDGRIFERYSHPQQMEGSPVGRVWSFRDVTERKKAEQELKDSETKFKVLFNDTREGILLANIKTKRFTMCNKAICRMLGYTKEEMMRLRLHDIHPTKDLPCVLEAFERQARGEIKIAAGLPVRKKDGSIFYADINASPIMVGDKKYLMGSFRDITERKRSEEALQQSEQRFRSIFESSRDAMMTVEPPSWKFTSANPSMIQMFKAKNEQEFMSYEPWALSPKRQPDGRVSREKAIEMIETAMRKGSNFFEWTHKRLDGEEFPAEVLLTRIERNRETFLHAMVRDITERKKVEEFRNDIVRTVSHELRTPLSIEKEGINLLLDGSAGRINANQQMILQSVMKNIDRLARMIDNLLDLSRIETGKLKLEKKPVDLSKFVCEAVSEFQNKISQKKLKLEIDLPKKEIKIDVDADKVTQVFGNLLDNAVKFTKRGSIQISIDVLKNEVECSIQDTGKGISSENTAKIFEKFQQYGRVAGPGEKGLGLGLSIARGIIEMHHGRIWVTSKLGKGTRVTFTLPRYREKGE